MAGEPEVISGSATFLARNKFAWYKEFRASATFNVNGMTCSDCFDSYEQSRIKGSDDFTKIKTADGSTVAEKLKKTSGDQTIDTARQNVKTALKEALKSDSLANEIKTFNDNMAALNKMMGQEIPEFFPSEIASFLLKYKGEIEATINREHDQAKERVEQLFTDPNSTFPADLKAGLECSDSELQSTKKEMLAAIDANKKEEFEKLQKSLNDAANELLNAETAEFERIALLAERSRRNKKMNAAIQRATPADDSAPYLQVNFDEGNAEFKNVDVDKVDFHHTIEDGIFSGRQIYRTGEKSFEIHLNRLYQSDASIYEDAASLAQTFKACGSKRVTLNISNTDPQRAEEHARIAFVAFADQGYEPKDIVLIVNGVTKYDENTKDKEGKQIKELFNNFPEQLQDAKKRAENYNASVKKYLQGTSEAKTTEIKDRLQKLTSNQEPAATQTQQVKI